MKFAVSITLLACLIHAAPTQEPDAVETHYDHPSIAVSIRTTSSILASKIILSHSTAPVMRPVSPVFQSPLLSDHDLDSQDSATPRSLLLEYWTTRDCPSAPSTTCYRFHSDFPRISKWLSWDCLIAKNLNSLLSQNGPDEVLTMIASIKAVADAAGIDPRVPFALLMQATSGAVRPPQNPTTPLAHGLFQVQIPKAATCDGTAFNKCAPATILAMIQDGIFGHDGGLWTTPAAPGIGYWIPAEAGDVPRGLRAYNSGIVLDRNDMTQAGRTGRTSFVSDIANWLVGASTGEVRPVTCL